DLKSGFRTHGAVVVPADRRTASLRVRASVASTVHRSCNTPGTRQRGRSCPGRRTHNGRGWIRSVSLDPVISGSRTWGTCSCTQARTGSLKPRSPAHESARSACVRRSGGDPRRPSCARIPALPRWHRAWTRCTTGPVVKSRWSGQTLRPRRPRSKRCIFTSPMIGTCTRRGSTSPKGWRSTRSEPGRDGRGTLVSPPEIVSVAIGFEVGPTLDPNTLVLNDPVRGLLDTGELGEANAFVTVTDDMRRITVIRGAQRVDSPVIRYETGTAEIV